MIYRTLIEMHPCYTRKKALAENDDACAERKVFSSLLLNNLNLSLSLMMTLLRRVIIIDLCALPVMALMEKLTCERREKSVERHCADYMCCRGA